MKKNLIDRAVQALFSSIRLFSSHPSPKRHKGTARSLPTLLRTAALTVALALGGSVQADNIFWNVATGKWKTAANWDTNLVPTTADHACIGNGGTTGGIASDVAIGAGSRLTSTIKM